MKFESYESDRQEWINVLARELMRSGICLDLTVICGAGDDERKSFRCHKILLLSFLKQYCPLECLEDVEDIILPDMDPQAFKEYLNIEYGLDALPKSSFAFPNGSDPLKLEMNAYDEDIDSRHHENESDKKEHNVKSCMPIDAIIQCRICYKVYSIRGSSGSTSSHYKFHFLKMHPEEKYYRPFQQKMMDEVEKYPCRECGTIFGSFEKQSNHIFRITSDSTPG